MNLDLKLIKPILKKKYKIILYQIKRREKDVLLAMDQQ